ncbi:hypothetical protein MMF94_36940 [Pseudonocardia alaniniphila]|uniref:Uncharacterized protein n=1 Tax=Pseudonocardia alaniniphila TaxID=75291 RepID=A0ABS9TRZ3_9PSEU|nr:hypothetical protein [Pseudonocardia alaniniphila]MCH6171312.1 hypothetical protein [Pseudonocardia alaniniphila]
MRRVRVGEQQAHRDRLGLELLHLRDNALDLVTSEIDDRFAVRTHPLNDRHDALTRHEWLGPNHRQVIQGRTVLPADLQDIAEPIGGDEDRAGDPALEHGVRRRRGAVRQQLDVAIRPSFAHPILDALGLVPRRRRHLDRARPMSLRVHNDVGEGATHIDARTDSHWHPMARGAKKRQMIIEASIMSTTCVYPSASVIDHSVGSAAMGLGCLIIVSVLSGIPSTALAVFLGCARIAILAVVWILARILTVVWILLLCHPSHPPCQVAKGPPERARQTWPIGRRHPRIAAGANPLRRTDQLRGSISVEQQPRPR